MRISSAHAFESSQSTLQRRQETLQNAQERLTSGKRVLRASDDPSAAAAAERAAATASRATSQQRALDVARTGMQLTESALRDAGELLQQIREQVVAAGNGSYTDAERTTMSESMRNLREELFSVANRSDGSGRYLFGGQGANTAPLVDAPGGVTYTATAGQLQAATGEGMVLSMDGRAAWLQAADPYNPGNTLSVFNTLDQTISELGTPGRSGAQIAQTVTEGLSRIDVVSGNLASWRSRAGEALSRADNIESRLSQTKLDATTEQSDATDLDMLSAISDFQNQQSGYDAALKTYSLVQRMSLFDYLK